MRVVFGTNILATFTRREALLQFKQRIASKQLVHITSVTILIELEVILGTKFGLTNQKAKTAARTFEKLSIVVKPYPIEPICRDPFDDHVLATAVAGRAVYVVTADKDLLVLGKYKNVKIVAPVTFWQGLSR